MIDLYFTTEDVNFTMTFNSNGDAFKFIVENSAIMMEKAWRLKLISIDGIPKPYGEYYANSSINGIYNRCILA